MDVRYPSPAASYVNFMDDVIDDTIFAWMILIAGMMLTARMIPNDSPLPRTRPLPRDACTQGETYLTTYVLPALLASHPVNGFAYWLAIVMVTPSWCIIQQRTLVIWTGRAAVF